MELKNREELTKLMKENPELPIVFLAQNDEFIDGYGSTFFENFYCKVDTVYLFEEEYSDDLIYVTEYYSDKLCDEEEYINLSDDEFDEAINKYIEENVEHYKAIIISLTH